LNAGFFETNETAVVVAAAAVSFYFSKIKSRPKFVLIPRLNNERINRVFNV
jgi:hypothetical protein